jgi:DNA-binding response OmpR family regulator
MKQRCTATATSETLKEDDKASGPDRRPRPDLTGLKVLVVEDNEDNRDMLTTYLNLCGAAVLQAPDVDTALSHISVIKFHALVSDLALSGKTGFDLIARIRSAGQPNSTIFAIAVSGIATNEGVVLAAGYDVHFMKPIELDELCDAILRRSR